MPNVNDLCNELERIAPLSLAESWDNVGLLVGRRDARVSGALLTIDLTEPVLEEAIRGKCQFVVAYHPPIFKPLTRLTDGTWKERIVHTAIARGIAIHAPHTALDAAPGGVNDWLAAGFGSGDVRPLTQSAHQPSSQTHKIVTFAPAESTDALRAAMSEAGAGRIGDYEQCSFEIRGEGTFHGSAGTSPAIGRRGTLERVDEIRFEMVSSASDLGAVVAALRLTHPYEEPPIEIHTLAPVPLHDCGAGRIVELPRATRLDTIIPALRSHLGVDRLDVAASGRSVKRIGLCAGAGGSMLETAIAAGCDAFFTGEMRHHDVLEANARGCTVILAGHTNTERGYLKVLRRTLSRALPKVSFKVARKDRDPLTSWCD